MPRNRVPTVQNLGLWSEDVSNVAYVTKANVVTPSATQIDFSSGGYIYQAMPTAVVPLAEYTFAVTLWSSNKAKIVIRITDGGALNGTTKLVTLTPTPTRYFVSTTMTAGGYAVLGLDNRGAFGGDDIAGTVFATELQTYIGPSTTAKPYVKTTTAIVNTGNPRNRVPTVQNLYKYSNALNTKTPNDVTFTLDSTVLNPFGGMTSLKMQEFVDASPQQHFVADSTAYPDIQPGDKFNASVFIRPNTRSKVMFAPFNAAGQYHACYFDLINKTSVLFTGTSLASNPLVEDYPNGFKRISLDCIAPSDLSTFYPRNYIWEALSMSNPASDVVYQADGTGIINLMGFQVTKGWGPKTYVETGATAVNTGNLRNRISSATPRTRINSLANYALNSENGVTGHTKFSIQNVTNAATIAPDGTLTAYKITEDSSNGRHFNFQSIGSVPIPSQICCSAYLKAGERRYANIRVDIDASIYVGVTFDLLTGVVTSTTQSVVKPEFGYGIVPAANGFFRCWVTDLNVASTNVNLVIGPSNSATPTYTTAVPDYQGDGVSGIYAWGEQLNRGSVPADYIKTTSAAITAGTTAPRDRV